MKNAVLPSVSSQLYSFGSNEAISDVPLQTGSIGYDCIISPDQQPFSLGNKVSSVPQYDEVEFQAIENPRKRRIEVNDYINEKGSINNLVSNISGVNEWRSKKKKEEVAIGFNYRQWSYEDKEEGREVHKEKVPVKRSQKLSDKITALQKLVSPYGKTDTASVLEEASISIKFLQDQILNLFNKLNTSYTNTQLHSQKTEDRQLDLQSRGLCLVPLSFTQKLKNEDRFDRQCLVARNF
ncbi:hypothetical protein LguiA_034986 [Lonicera macranthoides]